MSEAFLAFNNRRADVIDMLSELGGAAGEIGARTLAARIDRELVDKLREDRFNLVVVGEFNHGKTTLVNALLGRAALPVGVTPTTAVIHHVEYADEPHAALVSVDGTRQELPFEQLDKFTVLSPGAAAPDEGGKVDGLSHIDVGYPAELLRERIVLVDTPGVNDLCLQRADVTYKYIPQSDAVLFVIDAGQPLKESERLFLSEQLIGQSRDKIIFVVAKVDIWSDADRAEALDYIVSELGKLIEGPVVFAVSAQRALQGQQAESGVDELVAHLTAFLAEERGRIVLDNALGEGLEAARSLDHGIDARRRASVMSRAEIERRIARVELDLEGQKRSVEQRRGDIREEVAAVRAWVRRDLDRFVDDVIRQLDGIIGEAEVDDLRLHLAGFLETTFVGWARQEADEVARALEELAEKTVALMRDDAHDAAKRLSQGAEDDLDRPDIHIDTFGYDLGVAALFSVGLGMVFTNALLGVLMAGAAPVLAYYLKGRVQLQTRDKAREQAAVALREAAAKVAPKLDEMITSFAKRLDDWVLEASGEIHRELLDVLELARGERDDDQRLAVDTVAVCDGLAERLTALRANLGALRESLWEDRAQPPAAPPVAVAEAD